MNTSLTTFSWNVLTAKELFRPQLKKGEEYKCSRFNNYIIAK